MVLICEILILHLLCVFLGLLLFVPAPFLLELVKEEADAPSGFLADFIEDLEHFLLLTSYLQTFGSNGKGSKCHTCDATDMG